MSTLDNGRIQYKVSKNGFRVYRAILKYKMVYEEKYKERKGESILKRILERHIERGNEFARSLYRSCVIKFRNIDVVRNSVCLNCMMNLNMIGCEGNR